MGERSLNAIVTKILKGLRNKMMFFFKIVYLIPFFALGFWLLSTVYFHGFEVKKSISVSKSNEKDLLSRMLTKQDIIPREHFHLIDRYVASQDPNPPLCVLCHGTYAHGKQKETRSMLNMHEGFIACSVCHVRQGGKNAKGQEIMKSQKIGFVWVDRINGEFKTNAEGEYGKYPSMIHPITLTGQGPGTIYEPMNAEAAQQFLKTAPGLNPDQLSEARIKLHQGLSKEAVSCSDCHKKNGFIDFSELGFPKKRIEHIVSSEFVGMIDKYKTFYLPSVIDFREK